MTRLNVTVEGQTEQAFVVDVLTAHLGKFGVYVAKPRLTATAKKKGVVHRGGLRGYLPFRNDIQRWLKQDAGNDVAFTTMVDLYALPGDFPGYAEAVGEADPYSRVAKLEDAFSEDVADPRFIPYIQLHEFEALLFADPGAFDFYYEQHDQEIERLTHVRDEFGNPELIDDGQESAPSKRIGSEIAEYLRAKRTVGPLIAEQIGLETIRGACRHFNAWLTNLENLGQQQSPV